MARQDLESLGRDELITRAEALGVVRPQVLTRVELIDAIVQRTVADPAERRRARGFLGRVRDMLATMVERGLNLPEGEAGEEGATQGAGSTPAAVATVTLAEIYAAQGHADRALATLDEVLLREPDHEAARALRARLLAAASAERAATLTAAEAAVTQRSPEIGQAASEAAAASPGRAAEPPRSAPPPAAPPGGAPASASGGPPPPAPRAAAPSPSGPASAPPAAAAPRPSMLDDAPLPRAYGVDEAVVLPVDPTTAYVYWEARPELVARARAAAPQGHLVVRVFAASREVAGDESVRDIRPDGPVGDYFVHGLPAGASLRAALGWVSGDSFEPFAWSSSQSTPRSAPDRSVASRVVVWSLEASPGAPVPVPAPAGIALAVALAEASPGYDPLESPFGDETEGPRSAPGAPASGGAAPAGPPRRRLRPAPLGSSGTWTEEFERGERGERAAAGKAPGPVPAPARSRPGIPPRRSPLGSSDQAPGPLGSSGALPLAPRR